MAVLTQSGTLALQLVSGAEKMEDPLLASEAREMASVRGERRRLISEGRGPFGAAQKLWDLPRRGAVSACEKRVAPAGVKGGREDNGDEGSDSAEVSDGCEASSAFGEADERFTDGVCQEKNWPLGEEERDICSVSSSESKGGNPKTGTEKRGDFRETETEARDGNEKEKEQSFDRKLEEDADRNGDSHLRWTREYLLRLDGLPDYLRNRRVIGVRVVHSRQLVSALLDRFPLQRPPRNPPSSAQLHLKAYIENKREREIERQRRQSPSIWGAEERDRRGQSAEIEPEEKKHGGEGDRNTSSSERRNESKKKELPNRKRPRRNAPYKCPFHDRWDTEENRRRLDACSWYVDDAGEAFGQRDVEGHTDRGRSGKCKVASADAALAAERRIARQRLGSLLGDGEGGTLTGTRRVGLWERLLWWSGGNGEEVEGEEMDCYYPSMGIASEGLEGRVRASQTVLLLVFEGGGTALVKPNADFDLVRLSGTWSLDWILVLVQVLLFFYVIVAGEDLLFGRPVPAGVFFLSSVLSLMFMIIVRIFGSI
uniref:Transmembrane protein n=1 Tax=Chromera velia CCMP2878 TaxID=1169474 RepID=A0A0G4H8V8_9ALVE|eukprot:Cvel_25137.t1-p1 / transcript=Cvel_25137.t1 / gene=Cvel_25137 / organism=Chromera_velia_CCMP2878 / gene_product=hypothetical protein / transcript_product=hypothetical protein / location=Cvel_scaffold2810:768-4413(+) / protein_length=540 / sequence_SO=supercontig / SO=protein_coding / is_pseudo=false